MKLSFHSRVAGTLLMTAPARIYSNLAVCFLDSKKFLRGRGVLLLSWLLEYLRLAKGFCEVGTR
jgi:hypothetical protein